jgi:hypothetical protein
MLMSWVTVIWSTGIGACLTLAARTVGCVMERSNLASEPGFFIDGSCRIGAFGASVLLWSRSMLLLVNGGRWEQLVCFAVTRLFPFFVLASLSSASITQMMAAEAKGNVLILYDEPREEPGLKLIDRGIETELVSKLGSSLELYRETLDTTRFPGDSDHRAFVEYCRGRYASKKIELVVTVMAQSLEFMLKDGQEIFPGMPVVFCGLDSREIASRKLGPNATGVFLRRDFKGTLDLALKLRPQTQRFFFVAGSSDFDRQLVKLAREDLHQFGDRVTYITDLSLNATLAQV